MEATKERAARCNRATPARKSDSQPARGSRTQSITRRRRRAKARIRQAAVLLTAAVIVAGIGVIINGFTTWLFNRDKGRDLNIKATYMHMLADTLVSIGVIVSGVIIKFTGWNIIDPIIGLVIAAIILYSTWDILKDSIRLALDGTPEQFDVEDIERQMEAEAGVEEVHHIHIWAISTTEYALTAHVVISDIDNMHLIKERLKALLVSIGIAHSTLEFEDKAHHCNDESCCQ